MDLIKDLPTCIICFQVFKAPLIDSCGHTFCEDCAKHWLAADNKCPLTKIYLSRPPRPNLSLRGFLSLNLSVCSYVAKGCSWVGKLKALPKYHQPYCPFAQADGSLVACLNQTHLRPFIKFTELVRDDGSVFRGLFHKDGSPKMGVLQIPNGTRYEGTFEGGQLNGVGRRCDRDGMIYEGEFQNGRLHGHGVIYSSAGPVMEGKFVEGRLEGFGVIYTEGKNWKGEFALNEGLTSGTIHFLNGNRFEGEFAQGLPVKGTLELADKTVFIAEFRNLAIHGKGIRRTPDGQVYDGEFIAGLFDGTGELSDAKSLARFVGNFKQGKREGAGTAFINNAKVSEVTFKNDRLNGPENKIFLPGGSVVTVPYINGNMQNPIVWRFANGDVFTGNSGTPHYEPYTIDLKDLINIQIPFKSVTGSLVYLNGDKYEGKLLNGFRTGRGKFTFANKDVFEGVYKSDKANGPGTLKFSNNSVLKGTWLDDQLDGESTLHRNGKPVSHQTWRNGILIANKDDINEVKVRPESTKAIPKPPKSAKHIIR